MNKMVIGRKENVIAQKRIEPHFDCCFTIKSAITMHCKTIIGIMQNWKVFDSLM